MSSPKVFISYTWDSDEHRTWVAELARRLRADSVDAIIDRWALVPGDSVPRFMETSVRDSDFVLVVCTPNYKHRSDHRAGGAGYEGDVMTAEVFIDQSRRKFIPVLRGPTWKESAPSWLAASVYIDLNAWPERDHNYLDVLATVRGEREQAPPLGGSAVAAREVAPPANTPRTAEVRGSERRDERAVQSSTATTKRTRPIGVAVVTIVTLAVIAWWNASRVRTPTSTYVAPPSRPVQTVRVEEQSLGANAELVRFIRAWRNAVIDQRAANPLDQYYAPRSHFHTATAPITPSDVRTFWVNSFASGATIALDEQRSTWRTENVGDEPGATVTCSRGTGPIYRLRLWWDEDSPGRVASVPCRRLTGMYLVRLRRLDAGLRICYESWSMREGICASCPATSGCENHTDGR